MTVLDHDHDRPLVDVAGDSTANGALIDRWRWVQAGQEQFLIVSGP